MIFKKKKHSRKIFIYFALLRKNSPRKCFKKETFFKLLNNLRMFKTNACRKFCKGKGSKGSSSKGSSSKGGRSFA